MLKKTSFTSDTFSGSAEFDGTTAAAKGNGSYNGAFFGPTADRDNADVREQYPSLVAGQFSVQRSATTGTNEQTALTVHGAFGATHGALEDPDG